MNYRVDRFGNGVAETTILPVTVILTVIVVGLILFLPRKYSVCALLAGSVVIPMGQAVGIGPFHFLVCRILILVGWIRFGSSLLGQGALKLNSLDRAFVFWAVSFTIAFTYLYGNLDSFVNRLGFLYNTFGTYFLFRCAVQDAVDADRLIRVLARVCAVIAVFMVAEQFTGKNSFSILGGVPQFTIIRDGGLRSQGPFEHAILAGTFGAVMLPLFIGLWQWDRSSRTTALLGIAASTAMTITSRSSTPVMVYAAGIVALCFWPFRRRMRLFRWGVLTTLVALHLVMKAPVWALIGRMDVIGVSSGYHRYMLVDQTIRHFSEWWLCGVKETAAWGWDLGDTANQYVETAITGGVFTLGLFITVLVLGFQRIGAARKLSVSDPYSERRLWMLGACLFANLVAFVGITYFDQTQVAWFALLAMISSITQIPQKCRGPGVQRCGNWSEQSVSVADVQSRCSALDV